MTDNFSNDSFKSNHVKTVIRDTRLHWNGLKYTVQTESINNSKDLQNHIPSHSKNCESFSGIRHRTKFRVNKPISIIGLGFFGPHAETIAHYTVFIDVENSSGRTIFTDKVENVMAEREEIFPVWFKSPVSIAASSSYTMMFQLEGPKTDFCPLGKLRTDIGDFFNNAIAFQFNVGSKQMPVLYYEQAPASRQRLIQNPTTRINKISLFENVKRKYFVVKRH